MTDNRRVYMNPVYKTVNTVNQYRQEARTKRRGFFWWLGLLFWCGVALWYFSVPAKAQSVNQQTPHVLPVPVQPGNTECYSIGSKRVCDGPSAGPFQPSTRTECVKVGNTERCRTR